MSDLATKPEAALPPPPARDPRLREPFPQGLEERVHALELRLDTAEKIIRHLIWGDPL